MESRSVGRAAEILQFSERDAAFTVGKVLRSAVANAETNDGLDPEELYVSACFADEGPTIKRWRPRARGRTTRIRKRTCHITVIVSRMPENEIERRRAKEATRPGSRAARRAGQQAAEERKRRVRRSRQEAAMPEEEHDHDHDHEGHDHDHDHDHDHEGHEHEHPVTEGESSVDDAIGSEPEPEEAVVEEAPAEAITEDAAPEAEGEEK